MSKLNPLHARPVLGFALILVSLLLMPLQALALGISVVNVSSTGGNTALLADGDVLTVDLVVENTGNTVVTALGLVARGWDSDGDGLSGEGVELVGGQLATSALNTFSVAGPPAQGFGGLQNIWTSPDLRGNPFVPDNPALPGDQSIPSTEVHAVMFAGIDLVGVNGDGSHDVGVGGNLVSAGDVHFRLSFVANASDTGQLAPRAFTLQFGDFLSEAVTGISGPIAFADDSFSFSVVPEPGTALLLGLGLAGLAGNRRR